MKKTTIINVVGLTESLLKKMPFLSKWAQGKTHIKPVLPAVTCSAQSTYLTGKYPCEHGIVGNGWYFREDCEIKFWKQSNKLVQAPKIWDYLKEKDSSFTCANMFWWYNMYSNADIAVTPRPQYKADGRKVPDIYTHPIGLRDNLQKALGDFPLFNYWGPKANIDSTKWITEASIHVDLKFDPTLMLIYLPHLDYNLQRKGPKNKSIKKDLLQVDKECQKLIRHFESKGTQVFVLSEYGITEVNNAISINRILREADLITVREEEGKELLDAGASKAFAVADHQMAHVYINDKRCKDYVKALLEKTNGIEMVLDDEEKKTLCLDHERAGELIAVADKDSWFTYYYWSDDDKAPDFARTVDIHRKPGYDPVELFVDPAVKFPTLAIAGKVLKKKLGFRGLMDIVPLDPSLVKGSHGRIPGDKADWPVFLSKKSLEKPDIIAPVEVFEILVQHIQ